VDKPSIPLPAIKVNLYPDYTVKSMKYNQGTLDRLEQVLDEAGYIYRYERGNFQSGYCILEQKKVVVLNKFLSVEGRINILFELIPDLNIQAETLTPNTRKTYEEVLVRATTVEQ
jgi:hypothetical protein